MATVIKKISELEHLEELTSASNVIIEENGEAKRFSAASLGKVKTVNGVEPDENGNIEVEAGGSGEQVSPDWNQNDSTQPDYVKNRTHWVEGNQTVIEWDGNTEGRENFNIYVPVYKVSDLTPSYEELLGCSVVVIYNEDGTIEEESAEYGADDIDTSVEGILQFKSGYVDVCVCNLTEQKREEYGVPSNGIYFNRVDIAEGAYLYTSSFTYGSTTYHPLDEGFIPDTIARSADIPEVNYPVTSVNGMTGDVVIEVGSGGGVTSWNDLEDKPFGEVEGQTVIEWDGNTENRDYCSVGGLAYYKVSDSIPDVSEIVNHTIAFGNHPLADTGDYLVNDAEVIVHSGGYKIDCVIVVQNTSMEISGNRYTFPSTGTYFGLNTDNGAFVKRFEYGNYTIQTIDEKYIPDTIARKSDIHTSWNDLTDKPFMQESVNDTIEWDGTTDGRDSVTVGSYGYCKVCDLPSDDIVVTSLTTSKGMTMSAGGSNFTVTEGDGATNYANGVIVVKRTTFTLNDTEYTVPSTGLYFMYYGTMVYTATIAIEYESIILGQKYISDDIARSASFHGLTVSDAAGETVTAAEFNALLAALREAGYLAT